MTEANENAKELKVIVFSLNEEEYGVDIHQVRSIEQMTSITRVPQAPKFVLGVINLRGIVTPIIDLRKRFSLQERESENAKIVVVRVEHMEVGLVVDAASDVIDILVDQIEPPSDIVGGIKAEYLRGVAKLDERLLILLNLEKVLNTEEVAELKAFEDQK